MYSTSVFQFTTAIPLLLTLYTNYYNKRVLVDSTSLCLTNHYKDGNECKGKTELLSCSTKRSAVSVYLRQARETRRQPSFWLNETTLNSSVGIYTTLKECPVGYFGDNCTNICPSSYYGRLCVHECECLPCHYIYGCVKHVADTTKVGNSYETKDDATGTNKMPETTIYEHKTEDKPNCSNQTQGNMKISDTILVISVGSLLCAMLIFVIIREFCLCCRFPQPVGTRTTRDDVYANIAEMQNERTLTD